MLVRCTKVNLCEFSYSERSPCLLRKTAAGRVGSVNPRFQAPAAFAGGCLVQVG